MKKGSKTRAERTKILSFVPTGEYYFNKGMKAYHRRELNKALKYFERALQLEPLEPIIACQLSICYTEKGEYRKSNELLHDIISDLDPRMIECHYFLANNYAHLGLFKEAYKHVTTYLEEDEFGEFSEDAEDLLELLELDSDIAVDTLYEQDELIQRQDDARGLLESGNFERAVHDLKGIIEDYPEFWSAYNNLALAYFYQGKTDQAAETIAEVLSKNPGNLHALCNMAVFYFYQQRYKELDELVIGLEKIRPLLNEHRYKLGATFALIGRYHEAYNWLKSLQKSGFEGDSGFYYWLSHAAHHTGHHSTSQHAWKRVLELSPEKEGSEPWEENVDQLDGFENHTTSILKKLKSNYSEERLFGLFLTSVSKLQAEILSHADFCDIEDLSLLEKLYLAEVLNSNRDTTIQVMDEVKNIHAIALELYGHYQPINSVTSGLYLTWFTVAFNGLRDGYNFKNHRAFAGAVEQVWHRLRNEKITKKDTCEKYNVSSSTLTKYMTIVESYLV